MQPSLRGWRKVSWVLALAIAAAGGCRGQRPERTAESAPAPSAAPVAAAAPGQAAAPLPKASRRDARLRCGIEMRNVELHAADGIVLDVASLDGEMASRTPDRNPVFDDPRSYVMQLKAAELAVDAASLSRLLREQVFNDPRSAVRNVSLSMRDGALRIKGRLHKGIDVPFSMAAAVAPTADGRIRLHAISLKTAGIPVKGMLDLFGVELENLLKVPSGHGIAVEGDDLLLDPFAPLPPPATEGRVKTVRIEGERLLMSAIGPATPPVKPTRRPEPAARNFIYFYGGTITFGKLTMRDADMQLVDADARDAFDFFPDRYFRQLVAGYSRTTERGGLKVVMPDYHRVAAGARPLRPPPVE
jgi:hypothetical protein